MKKILIVETNTDRYDRFNIKTGLWIGEAVHFYNEILKKGYSADFVSPKGGKVPIDPVSMKFAGSTVKKWLNNREFKEKALLNTLSPDEVNPDLYEAIYYTGGHGVLWDFPDNEKIKNIAEKIYRNGGYVTSVCHGAVGLLNLQEEDGSYLIENRKVTGFTNTEELLSGRAGKVPYSAEDALKSRHALFSKKRFFKSYAVKDGHIITGQNPWSPGAVAKILLKELESEEK